jgi:TPR repeat protein
LICLASLPALAPAQMIRCTSPDGQSSTLQRGKCASPTDIQTPVVAKQALPQSAQSAPQSIPAAKSTPAEPGSIQEAVNAHEARNYSRAFMLLKPLAERGNPLAQMLMSDLYHFGRGVPKDDPVAYSWARKAADQGYANGQALAGVMTQEGWGTPKSDVQAAAWFRKAADQGNATAQMTLGFAYSNGRGVPKDETKALAWFRKAAEGGDADAQLLMGAAYREGASGLPKDSAQAKAWLRKAADQGNAEAATQLARLTGEPEASNLNLRRWQRPSP